MEIRLRAQVSQVTPESVQFSDGTSLALETVIWTAGVQGRPVNADLPVLRNGQGEGPANAAISRPPRSLHHRRPGIPGRGWLPQPMLGPVATQQGDAAARNILRQANGQAPRPFHYHNNGTMATIGRNAAIAHIWGHAFTGFPAWILWLGIHLYGLIGFRNRLLVLIDWAWDYLFYERAVRLIVSSPDSRKKESIS